MLVPEKKRKNSAADTYSKQRAAAVTAKITKTKHPPAESYLASLTASMYVYAYITAGCCYCVVAVFGLVLVATRVERTYHSASGIAVGSRYSIVACCLRWWYQWWYSVTGICVSKHNYHTKTQKNAWPWPEKIRGTRGKGRDGKMWSGRERYGTGMGNRQIFRSRPRFPDRYHRQFLFPSSTVPR